jgi:hypothetical protein
MFMVWVAFLACPYFSPHLLHSLSYKPRTIVCELIKEGEVGRVVLAVVRTSAPGRRGGRSTVHAKPVLRLSLRGRKAYREGGSRLWPSSCDLLLVNAARVLHKVVRDVDDLVSQFQHRA